MSPADRDHYRREARLMVLQVGVDVRTYGAGSRMTRAVGEAAEKVVERWRAIRDEES